jgi:hypothetical protein
MWYIKSEVVQRSVDCLQVAGSSETVVCCFNIRHQGKKKHPSPALLGHDEAFLEIIIAHGSHSMAWSKIKVFQNFQMPG